MREGLFQIGEVADAVGLSLRTVRYYEEIGLVVPVERTRGGFRLYDQRALERLHLVKQMKPLEFTLDDMREVLDLSDRLDSRDLSASERTALAERLEMFSAAAQERCDALAEQLALAESFATTLRQQVRRAKASPRPAGRRR